MTLLILVPRHLQLRLETLLAFRPGALPSHDREAFPGRPGRRVGELVVVVAHFRYYIPVHSVDVWFVLYICTQGGGVVEKSEEE